MGVRFSAQVQALWMTPYWFPQIILGFGGISEYSRLWGGAELDQESDQGADTGNVAARGCSREH